MHKTCLNCKTSFEITDEDLKFYEKVSPVFSGKKYLIPPPNLCPSCRAQRRLAFRNERKLYNRKCDLSGRQILSIFSDDKPYKVYDNKEWWSDKWDSISYGRDFDFSRYFFPQFEELWHDVPQMNIKGENNQNADYCNLTANCKNCYLVFESSNAEDCLYGYWLQKCNNCCDVSFSHESNFCYEVDNCYNCYNLKLSQNCINCSDSAFLFDCIGCHDCFMCANLRQKQYYIFNKQHSKEDYEKFIADYINGSIKNIEKAKTEFNDFLLKQPHCYAQFTNAENCLGDYIKDSKNCQYCFHAHDAQDCKYGEHVWRGSKNNMDVSTVGREAEMVYESINTGIGAFHNLFCIQLWSGNSNLIYCNSCFSSQNLFGCVGLRHKQYCILNKQYTQNEYELLVPKIIEYIKKTGEWGEFFPVQIAEFGYNETVAQEQYPLTKEEALKMGAKWKKPDHSNKYKGEIIQIPDNINEINDSIIKQILTCTACGKNYKIITQELEFHRKNNIPLPSRCSDCRHIARIKLRNPNKLWSRSCAKCGTAIKTTYSPERPEIVYCEACYLKEVY